MVQDNNNPLFESTTIGGRARRARLGMTLIEIMIVVLLLSIVAAMVIPNLSSTNYDQLMAAAHIVQSEFSYTRSLAIANGSPYNLTFDTANNQLIMTYSGTNSALNTLPSTPFRNPSDPPNAQITAFNNLPNLNNSVAMVGAYLTSSGYPSCSAVQFGPLGNTLGATNSTVLYLYSGSGGSRLYISISVDPVTGLATVGTPTGSIPVSFGG
jgi:prepilin-type N-terminal cleavage/methylation domain-containing protein